MIIRCERPDEYRIVEALHRDAFWDVNHPGADEHYLAHVMRTHADFVPELDLVAEVDGEIVGSIMYTRNRLTAPDGRTRTCLSFGPIGVRPDHKRQGIGKALMANSFEKARALGYDCVVIFGHPSNYVSSGFVSCRRCNVCVSGGVFPTPLLVRPLTDDAFDGALWTYVPSDVDNYDPKDAQAFDRLFPERETHVLPCQEEFYIYSHSSIRP